MPDQSEANRKGAVMLVKDALSERSEIIVVVGPDEPVASVAKSLRDKKKGLAVVCAGGTDLLGLISVIDISRAVADHEGDAPAMPASAIMNTSVTTGTMQDSVDQALGMMAEHNIRYLPVLDDGKIAAVTSLRELLQARNREAEVSIDEMRKYVLGGGYG